MRRRGSGQDWTDERITQLAALWAEGHSASEIGRRLGISKHAVVGKSHRLNLPGRPSPILARDPACPKPPKRAPALPGQAAGRPGHGAIRGKTLAPVSVPLPPLLPFVSRPGRVTQCCWPIGNPGERGFRFCEAATVPAKSYCRAHCDIAYTRSHPMPEGFVPDIAIKRMESRGTLTAVGANWNGASHASDDTAAL